MTNQPKRCETCGSDDPKRYEYPCKERATYEGSPIPDAFHDAPERCETCWSPDPAIMVRYRAFGDAWPGVCTPEDHGAFHDTPASEPTPSRGTDHSEIGMQANDEIFASEPTEDATTDHESLIHDPTPSQHAAMAFFKARNLWSRKKDRLGTPTQEGLAAAYRADNMIPRAEAERMRDDAVRDRLQHYTEWVEKTTDEFFPYRPVIMVDDYLDEWPLTAAIRATKGEG